MFVAKVPFHLRTSIVSGKLSVFWDNIRSAFPKDISGMMLAGVMGVFVAVETLVTVFVSKMRKKIGGHVIKTALGLAFRGLLVSSPILGALLIAAEMLSGVLVTTFVYKLWSKMGGFDLSGVWVTMLEKFYQHWVNVFGCQH